jgi:hypothetical protein
MKKVPSSEWIHGTRNTYVNHGCRCDACREATREYDRHYREANPRAREKDRERGKRYKERHPGRVAETTQKWRERNPDKVREMNKSTSRAYWERKYQITREEFLAQVEQREGRCDICGETDNRTLSLDHCHETNRNRGLLCRRCNMGLGCFGDNPMTLRKAAEYLEKK